MTLTVCPSRGALRAMRRLALDSPAAARSRVIHGRRPSHALAMHAPEVEDIFLPPQPVHFGDSSLVSDTAFELAALNAGDSARPRKGIKAMKVSERVDMRKMAASETGQSVLQRIKCGGLVRAGHMLLDMPPSQEVSMLWTSLIRAYFEQGRVRGALKCYQLSHRANAHTLTSHSLVLGLALRNDLMPLVRQALDAIRFEPGTRSLRHELPATKHTLGACVAALVRLGDRTGGIDFLRHAVDRAYGGRALRRDSNLRGATQMTALTYCSRQSSAIAIPELVWTFHLAGWRLDRIFVTAAAWRLYTDAHPLAAIELLRFGARHAKLVLDGVAYAVVLACLCKLRDAVGLVNCLREMKANKVVLDKRASRILKHRHLPQIKDTLTSQDAASLDLLVAHATTPESMSAD
ncbi:hypothetical protein PYCC9005_001552 [Savitreella phatthalungensis]